MIPIACAVRRSGSATSGTRSDGSRLSEIGACARALLARDPNAIAIYRGNPNAHNYGNLFSFGLLRSALGEPQLFTPATMDQMPHIVVNLEMLGHSALFPIWGAAAEADVGSHSCLAERFLAQAEHTFIELAENR